MIAARNAAEIVAPIAVVTEDVAPAAAVVAADEAEAAPDVAAEAVSAVVDTAAEAVTKQVGGFCGCVAAGDSPAHFGPQREKAAIKHRGLSISTNHAGAGAPHVTPEQSSAESPSLSVS